jgi:hypothetical protein
VQPYRNPSPRNLTNAHAHILTTPPFPPDAPDGHLPRYHGQCDVPFMMNSDDYRLSDPRFSGNWTVVGEGTYDHPSRTLTVADRVYSDWSLGDPPRTRITRRTSH